MVDVFSSDDGEFIIDLKHLTGYQFLNLRRIVVGIRLAENISGIEKFLPEDNLGFHIFEGIVYLMD